MLRLGRAGSPQAWAGEVTSSAAARATARVTAAEILRGSVRVLDADGRPLAAAGDNPPERRALQVHLTLKTHLASA